MNSLPACPAVRVARRALGGDGDYLRVEQLPADRAAHTVATLTADGGRALDADLARARAADRGYPPEGDIGILRSVVWALLHPFVTAVAKERILIALALDEVQIAFPGDDSGDEFVRVWWPAAEVHPVTDPAAAYRTLALAASETLAPLVRAVRDRTRISTRGLWRYVLEEFASVGPEPATTDPRPALAECACVEAGARGTPLGQRLRFVEFDHDGTRRQFVRRAACCFAHKWPPEPGEPEDGWERYCSTCPLIPVDESVRLVRQELTTDP